MTRSNDMQKHTFAKGELKSLNDLNQDLKSIFTVYALCRHNICVGTPILHKGFHFGTTKSVLPGIDYSNTVVVIDSVKLFQAVKNNKKDISGYVINDSILNLFSKDSLFEIGRVISVDSYEANRYIKPLESIPELKLSELHLKQLSPLVVENLVKNEIHNISDDKYRTRISREVIPGLKKSHNVFAGFSDIDDYTFRLYIRANRSCVDTMHVYKCLYI